MVEAEFDTLDLMNASGAGFRLSRGDDDPIQGGGQRAEHGLPANQ